MDNGLDYQGGLHGLEHVMANISSRQMLLENTDMGSCSESDTVYLYDSQPGLGAAEKVYAIIGDIIRSANASLENCACKNGCPLCIQRAECERGNSPLDKGVTQIVISKIAGETGL